MRIVPQDESGGEKRPMDGCPPVPAFPSRVLAAAALIGAVLAQMSTYSAMIQTVLRAQVGHNTQSPLIFLAHIAGYVAGVAAIPPAAAYFRRSGRRPAALPFAVLLAACVGVRAFWTDPWINDTLRGSIHTFSVGIVASGVLMFFFSIVPPGRRGLWYGLGMGAGFAWCCVMQALSAGAADVAEVRYWHNLFFHVQDGLVLCMAALALWGLTRRDALPPIEAEAECLRLPRSGVSRLRALWNRVGKLAGTLFLFYLAAAFMGANLFPLGRHDGNGPGNRIPLLMLAAASPLFGRILDRACGGMKKLLLVCSVFLMLAPTLHILSDSPILYSTILTCGMLAQFAVSLTAAVAVAGRGTTLAWYGAVFLFQIFLRVFSYLGYFVFRAIPGLDGGGMMLLATLAAIGFHFAVRKLEDDPGDAPVAEPAPAPAVEQAVEAPVGEPAPGAGGMCGKYGLSKREGEVVEALAAGKDPAEIARDLFISEYTVKTHLRNIMAKMDVSGRSALLLKLLREK